LVECLPVVQEVEGSNPVPYMSITDALVEN